MTPLAYAAKELGVGDVGTLDRPDRDALKQMAAEEMQALGVPQDAA